MIPEHHPGYVPPLQTVPSGRPTGNASEDNRRGHLPWLGLEPSQIADLLILGRIPLTGLGDGLYVVNRNQYLVAVAHVEVTDHVVYLRVVL